MSDKIEVNNGGLGLASILTIIFVIAKLAGVIHWSWWVVFSPALVSLALTLIVLAGVLIVGGVLVYLGLK